MDESWRSFVAGGMSGMTVDFLLFPLDTIKTRLQARKSVTAAATKPASFYKGLFTAMIASFPGAAVFWTVYQSSKPVVLKYLTNDSASQWAWAAPISHSISASLADTVVCVVRNPFEVVKQQLQIGLHHTMKGAVREIVRVDGVRGLYAGFGATIARDVPFAATQFVCYEYMKSTLTTVRGRELNWLEFAALGFICGGIAGGITTPLDVARTRLMTQTRTHAAHRYTGVLSALIGTVKEGGLSALFLGIRPRMTWISIGGAIFIGSFEQYNKLLHKHT